MKSEKEIQSYLTGYLLGQKIKEGILGGIGIIILVILWIIPLAIFDLLNIGNP